MEAKEFLDILKCDKFKQIGLDDKTDIHALAVKVLSTPPIVILGSAISQFEPTLKPPGQNISQSIAELLIKKAGSDLIIKDINYEDSAKMILNEVLFEQCFERCPDQSKARNIVNDYYASATPNEYHEILAKAMIQGKISGLITTNYDNCIDECLYRFGNCAVTKVVEEKDAVGAEVGYPIYFKIHGTCDDHGGKSICFSLSNEARLAQWKRELLQRMTEGRTVLFIGYSGYDFEICSELYKANRIAKLFWNAFDFKNPSPNFHDMLERFDGTVLIGDMFYIFKLFKSGLKNKPNTNNTIMKAKTEEFQSELGGAFQPYQFRLWLIFLLTSCGHPLLSNILSQDLRKQQYTQKRIADEDTRLQVINLSEEQIAHSAYKMGRYRQGYHYFFLTLMRKHKDILQFIPVFLDFLENARTGYFLIVLFFGIRYARRAVKTAEKLYADTQYKIIEWIKARMYGRDINYHKLVSRFADALHLATKMGKEKKIISDLEVMALKAAENAGDWVYWTAIQANAENEDGTFEKTIRSSCQMGLYFEAVYAFRKRLQLQNAITSDDKDKLNDHITLTKNVGIYPEHWKLLKLKKKLTCVPDKEADWRGGILRCQYSLQGYLMHLLFPESGIYNV